MFEVIAQVADTARQSDSNSWSLTIISTASAALVGVGGAFYRLGVMGGNFLAPLIKKLVDSHVGFLSQMETSISQQVEVGKQQAAATEVVGQCVSGMKAGQDRCENLLANVHKKVCEIGCSSKPAP